MDTHRQAFKEEAYELLTELESSLLELEERPDDTELIGRVFRAMHTIKGSGAMFGFEDIAAFTHNVETVFDLVRDGKIKVTKEIINQTLAARDQISAMLAAADGGAAVDEEKSKQILAEFKKLLPDANPEPEEKGSEPATPIPLQTERSVTYRIRVTPTKTKIDQWYQSIFFAAGTP